jgi:hypothetical protein
MKLVIKGTTIDLFPESDDDKKTLESILEKKTFTALPQIGASTRILKGLRLEHLPKVLLEQTDNTSLQSLLDRFWHEFPDEFRYCSLQSMKHFVKWVQQSKKTNSLRGRTKLTAILDDDAGFSRKAHNHE